jgi:hypothetical protein
MRTNLALLLAGLMTFSSGAAMAAVMPPAIPAAPEAVVLAAKTCPMAPSYWTTLAQKRDYMNQLVAQYNALAQVVAAEQGANATGIFSAVLPGQIAKLNQLAQQKNAAINDYGAYLDLQDRCG